MTIEPPLFDSRDPEADRRSDACAEADIQAGRIVGDAEVRAWLARWGTPDATPLPREWQE